MKIIDSHVHLNSERFDEDRDEVLKRIEKKIRFCCKYWLRFRK